MFTTKPHVAKDNQHYMTSSATDISIKPSKYILLKHNTPITFTRRFQLSQDVFPFISNSKNSKDP